MRTKKIANIYDEHVHDEKDRMSEVFKEYFIEAKWESENFET